MKNKKYLFIVLLIIPLLVLFISRSFSITYTEEIKSVEIQSSDYNQPGSWHIDKSAEWTGFGKARVTFEVNSIAKTVDGRYKDVILVMDISGSMNGSKLDRVKQDAIELTNYLLSDSHNKIALITFDTTSQIVSGFINNKTQMVSYISNLNDRGCTNYNAALLNVDIVMENYVKENNKDLIVLFLTDGYPNEDIPNQVATYQFLKDKYPYMIINGIQYEIGKDIIQEIIDVSDNQWVADQDTLHNVLFDATVSPLTYDNFVITDYINDEYFYANNVSDIKVDRGEVSLTEENGIQKVIWNLEYSYKTGDSIKMTIDLELKEEYKNTKGYYPTNKSETIVSKLPNELEKTVNSTLTPVLKNVYNVIYDTNKPNDCALPNYDPEEHYAYQNVTKKTENLSCPRYLFKGWVIDDNDKADMTIINDDMFVMPFHDVHIRGTWTKQDLAKSMDGEVHVKTTLYKVLENEATVGTYAKKYTGAHQDSMDNSGTSDIYYFYANDSTNSETIVKEKNNVIFANQCWQMYRTTDTGGVKMIYNGEAVDGKCLSTRGNHVGYASRTTQSMSTTYYYGTSYTYDSTNSNFTLSGDITTGEIKTGEYTCKATSADGTCTTLYYVDTLSSGTTYYVLPLNTNSNYSQFGTLQFNANYDTPSYVGYMYNTVYPNQSKSMTTSETMLSSSSLSNTYWYAAAVTWGSPTASKYNLDNPYKTGTTYGNQDLVGKYTFRSSKQAYTSSAVYYIAAVYDSNMYYIQLTDTGNHTLADFNYTYTYGESYTDNGDGTYTINNPTTISRSDWYTEYSNVGSDKYVCKNAVNNTCSELWYTTSTSKTSMTYMEVSISNVYKYAKEFEYKLDPEDNTYKYFLDDDTTVSFWNINDSTNKTSLNNAHYTCWNNTGECTTISYIYFVDGITPYYINIIDGKSIEDAVNEMLYNDNVNNINSTIKTGVDAWYKKYILNDYDQYVEDTIYCNDRSHSSTDGWNPNGGSVSTYMHFKEHNITSDLSCTNDTDKFSTQNNKAKLTYKVGLATSPEMKLLGRSTLTYLSNLRKTGHLYWLASPFDFRRNYAFVRYITVSGNLNGEDNNSVTYHVEYAHGVRPVISLIPGIEYSEGNGSMETPYIVDTSD